MIDELPQPEEEVMHLDAHVKLLAEYDEARTNIEFWTGELEKAKTKLAAIMGDATIGLVGEEKVLVYRYENRFRGTDFKKTYPDTYRLFTRDVTRKEFDVELFKASRPDLFDEFRARPMKSSFNVS